MDYMIFALEQSGRSMEEWKEQKERQSPPTQQP